MRHRIRSCDRRRYYASVLAASKDREIYVQRNAIAAQDNPLETVRLTHSLKAILLG